MSVRRVRVRVTGVVQGVGFRWFTRDVARQLGIAGTVRNEADGAVMVDAEGSAEAIDGLLQQLRRGPPHARVAAVAVEDSEPTGGREFTIDR
jgi:acylphosphatase